MTDWQAKKKGKQENKNTKHGSKTNEQLKGAWIGGQTGRSYNKEEE